jgi:hypothetical protein
VSRRYITSVSKVASSRQDIAIAWRGPTLFSILRVISRSADPAGGTATCIAFPNIAYQAVAS